MEAPGDEGPPPTRWEVELEFVQSLANPLYVNYLAQNKYFEDESFLRYLTYLEYWRKPQNAKFLVYPGCLHILTLLKQPAFRQEIAKIDVAKMVMDDMYHAWAANEATVGDGIEADRAVNTEGGDGQGSEVYAQSNNGKNVAVKVEQ